MVRKIRYVCIYIQYKYLATLIFVHAFIFFFFAIRIRSSNRDEALASSVICKYHIKLMQSMHACNAVVTLE